MIPCNLKTSAHFALIFGAWLLAFMRVGAAGAAALNPAGLTGESRPTVDLSGEWEFRLDPRDAGRREGWFETNVAYERTIQVPGAWNSQGVAFESETQLREYESQWLNGRNLLGEERESVKLFHVYPGPGWYRKKVTVPAEWSGKAAWLVFKGVHREAEVWINAKPAGSHRSYLTPLRIDLGAHARPGETVSVVVRVDARRRKEVDPLMGCLDTLDFLYVSWGGLHRPVVLEAIGPTRMEDVFIVPNLAAEVAEIRVGVQGLRTAPLEVEADILDAGGVPVATARRALGDDRAETAIPVPIAHPKLWSPRTPHLYTARLRLRSAGQTLDARSVRFGMREFKVRDGTFLLNGKPIFLRGYGDDCIFPNSICPPAEKDALRRRLATAREYGFNYVRHHSWTPPEEYLEAADELGMMLQPEFPFAYRWDLPTTPEAKRLALEQWEAMIRMNRNHPSIVTWCMGNEQYDSFDLAPDMYRSAMRLDGSRPVIDSDGCNFKHRDRETLDFLVVQFNEGESIGHQDNKYGTPDDLRKPVIAHEMGYFVTLPDLSQLGLFQSGLRPYWLLQARELADRKGVLSDYPQWLEASYRLQAASLKSNLEAARRSRLSGTSVWLFQDYPNCAEGVVDMFLRPKALRPEAFLKFNAPTVLLLDAPRRNWRWGEEIQLKVLVSRFEDAPTESGTLLWNLSRGAEVFGADTEKSLRIHANGLQEVATVTVRLPERSTADPLTFSAVLVDANGKADNAWNLWAFPSDRMATNRGDVRFRGFPALRDLHPWVTEQASGRPPSECDLLVTTGLDAGALDYLKEGGRVMLLEPEPAFAVEKTNFRLSSWDGGGPSGTLIDMNHASLRGIPSEGWCDLQFYSLIQGSKTVLLDELPNRIQPIVRCIDRPTRLANRAYLFEASVGRGRLLVSGFNFAQSLASGDPAGTFLLDRLVRYALGPEFAPGTALEEGAFKARTSK